MTENMLEIMVEQILGWGMKKVEAEILFGNDTYEAKAYRVGSVIRIDLKAKEGEE